MKNQLKDDGDQKDGSSGENNFSVRERRTSKAFFEVKVSMVSETQNKEADGLAKKNFINAEKTISRMTKLVSEFKIG